MACWELIKANLFTFWQILNSSEQEISKCYKASSSRNLMPRRRIQGKEVKFGKIWHSCKLSLVKRQWHFLRLSDSNSDIITGGRFIVFTIDVLDQCPLQDIQMVLISLNYVMGESRHWSKLWPLPCEHKLLYFLIGTDKSIDQIISLRL